MSEQGSALTGDAVTVRDGKFYIEGNEVTEAEARAAGYLPEAPSEPETAPEGEPGTDAPPSVEDRLRRAYKSGQGERRKTIAIAPGLFQDLAARFQPVDWDLRRTLIRQAERKGESGPETDLRINSTLMANACISMMFRPHEGAEYAELHTLIERFKGGTPIRFDSRLAEVLGMELIGGESEADICRLVFGGDGAVFESHYIILNGWSIRAFDDDEEGEDGEDEGGGRPT